VNGPRHLGSIWLILINTLLLQWQTHKCVCIYIYIYMYIYIMTVFGIIYVCACVYINKYTHNYTHIQWRARDYTCVYRYTRGATYTGWRRLIGCLKLQVIFFKRATNYRAVLRKMSYEDVASYDPTPPCIQHQRHTYTSAHSYVYIYLCMYIYIHNEHTRICISVDSYT